MTQLVPQQTVLEKLTEVIAPIIASLGYELWGCVLCGVDGRSVLRIYIDVPCDAPCGSSQQGELTCGKRAVNLDDCRKISHEISAILDVEDLIRGRYSLEVSSPGLDRQLFTEKQYYRFIGSMINVRLSAGGVEVVEGGGKRKNFKGILEAVENAVITLKLDNNESVNIPLAHITKANIIPEF